jgi:phosphatidylglycerophosphatase A
MKLQFTYGRLPPGLTLRDPATLAATWFGSGLIPFASGTWGSLAALPFAYGIWLAGGWIALAVGTIAVSALGVWASARVVANTDVQDPGAGRWS